MSNAKPKVLVCLFCTTERSGWLCPELVTTLMAMSHDPRFHVTVSCIKDARPFDMARNQAIKQARDLNVAWVCLVDNDNFMPGGTPLDIIAAAGPQQNVIGLTYGVPNGTGYMLFPPVDPGAKIEGPFREVQSVGGGMLMVNQTVWKKIPKGPWFKWQNGTGETLDSSDGTGCGEDVAFSRLVRRHGLRVWTHTQMAVHYKTTDLTGMVHTLALLAQGPASEQPKQGGIRRAAERVAGAFGFGE